MKKKFGIILLALALCAMAAFVTACGGNKTGEKTDYDWKYEKEFVDEHDADMTIDGDLSEARWQDRQYLTHVQDGVAVNYTTIFTEKGLYIGAKAQDPDMKWSARFNFSSTNSNPANSAFWFNIKGSDVQDGHAMRAFNFFVDAFDSASRNQTRFEAKAKTNGDIMKFEATEMTAELFVSWDALNIDTTDGLPEFVRIIPYYRHVKNVADAGENKWITPIFIYGNPGWDYGLTYDENLHQNWYRPIAGMKFGSAGYINADKPGAVVGDAANGYSKSSGWDLTRIDEGVVKAEGPDEQAIFFKSINSSKYMVSAKMKMLGGATHAGNWKDQYPSAGLISMRDETESIAFYVHGRSILDGAASWNFHTLDKYTGWNDVGEGNYAKPEGFNPATDRIELKCIQYDENLFYFINNELVLIKRVDWIKDGACPGLYGLSAEVEFSDFQAADYTDNTDALKAIISEYAYNVSVTAGDGGFVTVDKTALRKGDSLTVTVTPNAGFVLSSFKVNGVDRYDYVVNNLAAGKVTFADIEADSAIEATFARLSGGVRVTGKISAEGRAVTTSLLTLTSPADKRVFYTAAPTSNGSFNFTLSPAGTYVVGEKTITLDGNYVLNIKTAGYRDRTIEITVNADDKSVRVPDVELEKNVVGGSVTIGGRTFDSSVNTWDMSGEADSVIYAENGSNGSLAYFTDKTGKDAVIDFTIGNKTEITEDGKYEAEPCMGVSLTDGSNRFEIFVFNEGLRISPKGWWNGGGEAYNVSVPVSYSLRAKENPETLTFRLVRSGEVVAMLFKDGDDYVEIWRARNATFEKMSAYAFTVCQSQPCRLEFSNYSIKLGDEVQDYIETVLYETVTLGEYDTTKGTATIGGTTNGKIKYGDKFTVTIDSDKTAIVTYGDKAEIIAGGGEVSFTAIHSGEVTVSFADSLVSVTGSVALGENLDGLTIDYTKTELGFTGEGYALTYSGIVKADGTFAVDLPSGEYTITATNPAAYAKATAVTISEDNKTAAVKFTLVKPANTENLTFDAATGKLTNSKDIVAYFGSGSDFVVTTYIDRITTDWKAAGVALGGANTNMRILIRKTNDAAGACDVFVHVGGGYIELPRMSDPFANGDRAKLTVVRRGASVKIFVNDNYFGRIEIADGTAVKHWGTPDTKLTDHLGADEGLRFGLSTGDSTNATFSDWGYGLKFDELYAVAGRTLTLSDGITAKVGETEVTDGKVLLGDTVTVSIESANLVTFSVDGVTVTTDHNENVYTASFTVTGNHTVTYEESYAIGGSVTSEVDGVSAFEAAVKVLDESGATVTDCTAGTDGKFTFVVRNGVYKVYAIVDGKAASLAYTVKIANGAIAEVNGESTALNIALTKRLASSAFGYDPNTGSLTGQDRTAGYLYGAEVNAGEPFVLTAIVKRQAVTNWPAIGLIVGAGGDNYVQFAIRKCCPDTGVYYDFMMRRQSNSDTGAGELYAGREFGEALRADAFGSDDIVKLTVVYYGGNYFVYMDDALTLTIPETVSMYGTPLKDVIGSGKLKLGLFAEQTGTFTDWGYEIGKTAVAKFIGRTLSLPEGATAKAGETEVTDGKVLLGDTVTVSIESANLVTFSVDGVTVTTDHNENVYTASFTVTGNHTVTYEEAYEVSGTISYPDYATADLASTVLKFIKDGAATEFTDIVGASGEYSVFLSAGEYTVRAEHAGFMPAIGGAIAVTNAAVENVNVAFTLVKPDMSGLTFDENTGKITNSGDITAYFGSGSDFAVTTYVDKITTDWKGAGIVVRDVTKTNFLKITLRKIAGGYDLYANLGDGYIAYSSMANPFVLNGERAKLSVVRMASNLAMLKVYVNDKFVTDIKVEDATVVTRWGQTARKLTDYLSPDGEYSFGFGTCDNTNATFSDWSYVTGNERKLVLSDGITAKVSDTPVTNGKVSLGSLVVVSKVSDVPVMIAANGIYLNTSVSGTTYTAQFYASSHKVVTASPYYTVGGAVTKTSVYGADSAKSVAATVIKAYSGGNLMKTFENKVNADGTYSIELPEGAWVLDFENASFMTVTNFIEVKGNASNVSNVNFGLAKIDSGWVYSSDAQSVTPGAAENNVWKIFSGSAGSSRLLSTVTVANLITTNDVWASTGIYVSSSAQSTKHVYFALGEYVGTAGDKGAIKIRILCEPWLDMGLVVATETDVDYQKATLAVCVTEASVRLYLNGNLAYTISATENADKYATLRDTYGFFTSGATYTSGIKVVKQGGVPITAFDWTGDTAIISALG